MKVLFSYDTDTTDVNDLKVENSKTLHVLYKEITCFDYSFSLYLS